MSDSVIEIEERRRLQPPPEQQPVTSLDPTLVPEGTSPNGFSYRGETRIGYRIPRQYFISIPSPSDALHALRDAGISVAQLKPRRGGLRGRNKLPGRIELAQLAEQIGDQMEAGVSIITICESIGRNHRNGVLREALLGVAEDIRQGATIADAFANQRMKRKTDEGNERTGPNVFPVQLVHAFNIGENTAAFRDPQSGREVGAMQVMMQRFAEDQLKADELGSELRGAMMYPVGLAVITTIVIIVMMYAVVPKMKDLYVGATGDENAQLPFLTRMVVEFSNFITSYWGAASIVAFIVLVFFAIKKLRTEKGTAWLDRKLTFSPLFGQMIRDTTAAYVLRNMALLASGQSDLKAVFHESARSTTNPYYKEMLESIRHRYREQSTTLDVLFRPYAALLGEEFHTICLTYEKTGGIETLFLRYAQVLEKRAERRLKVVKHLLERYVALPLFGVVGMVIVALYLPMLDILGKLANAK